MKITDLEIDRYGVWRDLTLPLSGAGPHLLYGPNEAGKSTLKRFVRAMLYGGPLPEPHGPRHYEKDIAAAGALWMTHDDQEFYLHRALTSAGSDQIELRGPDDDRLPPGRLEELLAGTSEAVFDRLFSIDLFELQELARLDHRELAGHVYGLSLGAEGRRLLRSVEELRAHKALLCSDDGTRGRLPALLAEEQSLSEQIRSLPNLPRERGELMDQREQLDEEIAQFKRRRSDVAGNLRGRRFIERVHPAWRQARDYRSELSQYASVADLPPDGLSQLDSLDNERERLTRRRDEFRSRAEDARRRAERLGPEPEFIRNEPAVRAMIGMRAWVRETEEAQAAAPSAETLPTPHARPVPPVDPAELGSEWTAERLERVDVSPQAQLALQDAAQRYRHALGRRTLLRRRYKKAKRGLTRREAAVEEQLEDLGTSPDAAAAALRRELSSLETRESLAELRGQESVYARRAGSQRNRWKQLADVFDIPPWVNAVLALFALGGAIFAFVGLVTSVTHSWVAGLAYLFLGLTSGSIAVKLRSHFEEAIEETRHDERDAAYRDEVELRRIREELQRLGGEPTRDEARDSTAVSPPFTSARRRNSIGDQVREAVKQFGEIDDVVSAQARIQSRRKDLTRLRERMRKIQRHVEEARQHWCQTLVQIGMPESLDLDRSLETWQAIARSVPVRVVPVAAESGESRRLLAAALESFGTELATLGRRWGLVHRTERGPLAILDEWERRLEEALETTREQRRHLAEREQCLESASESERRLEELGRQQTALLAAAGVRSRRDYEQRLATLTEREELREMLQLAEMELESLASTEPDLAIVESDMLAFHSEDNRAEVARLVNEQEGLEAKLEGALERRGQIVRRIEELAADNRSTQLGRRKARIESLLARMSSRLLAVSLAGEAAEDARLRYERERQPAVLESASEMLSRLTRGRYKRIWSPLGQRTLCVDDDRGRGFSIEELSGGTREQLLLALRLGMVRRAAEQGIELPLILDDVFVNFDQLRTEAAFETLQDLAEEGRQILFFTCHLHLAHLAEQRGVAPVWLPGHETPMHRQKMAG